MKLLGRSFTRSMMLNQSGLDGSVKKPYCILSLSPKWLTYLSAWSSRRWQRLLYQSSAFRRFVACCRRWIRLDFLWRLIAIATAVAGLAAAAAVLVVVAAAAVAAVVVVLFCHCSMVVFLLHRGLGTAAADVSSEYLSSMTSLAAVDDWTWGTMMRLSRFLTADHCWWALTLVL